MKVSKNDPLAGSTLPRTILEINPGEDRKAERLIKNLSKLTLKTNRTSEQRRIEFVNTFETRRQHRQKLYERLRPKMDSSVREAIDRIKEERKRNEFRTPKKKTIEKKKIIQKNKGSTKDNTQFEQQSVSSLDWTSETGLDLSRRSSLKSSILGIGLSRGGSPGPILPMIRFPQSLDETVGRGTSQK